MSARAAAPWALAAGGLLLAALVFALGPYPELVERLRPASPLEESPAASLADARIRIAALDGDTRALYAVHQWWDLAAALGNAALLGGLLVGLARRWPRLARAAWSAPLALIAAELVENASLATLLAEGPSSVTVALAKAATLAKFAIFVASTVAIALLAVARVTAATASRVRRRGRSTACTLPDSPAV